jgi:hypothetical protein
MAFSWAHEQPLAKRERTGTAVMHLADFSFEPQRENCRFFLQTNILKQV